MATVLPTLTAAQVRTFVDALSAGVDVKVTWSSAAQPVPVVWAGTVVSVDAANHTAQISYPEKNVVTVFPPVHACTLHKLESFTHADPWAHAEQSGPGQQQGTAPHHLDPKTWGMFVEGASQREKDLALFSFSQWYRGRHAVPDAARNQKGSFQHHRKNDVLRGLEAWVRRSQTDPDWRNPANTLIAESLVACLEAYHISLSGGDVMVFGARLEEGKSVKDAAQLSGKKGKGGGVGGN